MQHACVQAKSNYSKSTFKILTRRRSILLHVRRLSAAAKVHSVSVFSWDPVPRIFECAISNGEPAHTTGCTYAVLQTCIQDLFWNRNLAARWMIYSARMFCLCFVRSISKGEQSECVRTISAMKYARFQHAFSDSPILFDDWKHDILCRYKALKTRWKPN